MSGRRPRSYRKPPFTELPEDAILAPPQVTEGDRRKRTAQESTSQTSLPKQSGSYSRRTSSSSSSSSSRANASSVIAAAAANQRQPLQAGAPALEAKYILSHPRLQQTTGMLPRKLEWWQGVELPHDELLRLTWAMSLPDTYPKKKPKGNF